MKVNNKKKSYLSRYCCQIKRSFMSIIAQQSVIKKGTAKESNQIGNSEQSNNFQSAFKLKTPIMSFFFVL